MQWILCLCQQILLLLASSHLAVGLQQWPASTLAKARVILTSAQDDYGVPICPASLRLEAAVHRALGMHKMATDVPFGPVLLAQMFGMGFYVSSISSSCRVDTSNAAVLHCGAPSASATSSTLRANITGCRLLDQAFPTDAALSALMSAVLQFAPDPDTHMAAGTGWTLSALPGVLDALLVQPPVTQGPGLRFQAVLTATHAGGGVYGGLSTHLPDARTTTSKRFMGRWEAALEVPCSPYSSSTATPQLVSYSLEVLTLWLDLSPTGEPSTSERVLQKGSRINEGSSIALSGMGNRPKHVQLLSRHRFDYAGCFVQTPGDKHVYFIDRDQRTRVLGTWDMLVDMLGRVDRAVNASAQRRNDSAVLALVASRATLDVVARIQKITVPLLRSFVFVEDSAAQSLDDVDVPALVESLWAGINRTSTSTSPRAPVLLTFFDKTPNAAFPDTGVNNLLSKFRDHVKLPVLLPQASSLPTFQQTVIFSYSARATERESLSGASPPLCGKSTRGNWLYAAECAVGILASAEGKTQTFLGYFQVMEHARNAQYWLSSNHSANLLYTYVDSNTLVDTVGSRCGHTQAPYAPYNGCTEGTHREGAYAQSGHVNQVLGPETLTPANVGETQQIGERIHAELNQQSLQYAQSHKSQLFDRPDGIVFFGAGCQLVQFLTHRDVAITVQQLVPQAKMLAAMYTLENSSTDTAKTHCDTMAVLASVSSTHAHGPSASTEKGAKLVRVPSLAAFSLFSAGVGLLSGFGDSLGDEQLYNCVDLFDQTIGSAYESNRTATPTPAAAQGGQTPAPPTARSRGKRHFSWDFAIKEDSDFQSIGISCVGNAVRKIHNLAPKQNRRANSSQSHFPLIECIESDVEKLFTGTGGGYMQTPVYDVSSVNISLPRTSELYEQSHYAGMKPIWIRQKIRKVVVATNFRVQHETWQTSLAEIEMALKQQADAHAQLASRLQEKYQVRYQRIFISAHAVHGFITAGLTPSRQESVNALAHKILRAAGWEIVDAYNMSLARPDLTVEGLHTKGGLSRALTDVILNAIANEEC